MTDTTDAQDPAEIERDIRRTQDEMSRTVDRIGDQLAPRTVLNALLDKADSNNIDARKVLDGARRNPLALAMIAGGTIWLISENDAKLPSFGSGSSSSDDTSTRSPSRSYTSSYKPTSSESYADPEHRDYVAHMSGVEWNDQEDPAAYQRRRDIARANYFMVERGHDEDESAFRQRLDQAAEQFRAKRQAWSEQVQNAGNSVLETGHTAVDRASQLYTENPLVGGLIAAAVGAVFGSLLPISETEEEQLGSLGEKARELANEQKDKLTEVARDKKDELVSKIEETAQGAGQPGQGGSQAGLGASQTGLGASQTGQGANPASGGAAQNQFGGPLEFRAPDVI
jgi:ElaB/YqjD/DUF883 family membrane-anchored ribosome-binding protein